MKGIMITLFTVIILMIVIERWVSSNIKVTSTEIRGHIGEILLIDQDTLMVIDYDFKKSKFVLSNDELVSSDFLINYKQLTK